MRPIVGKTLLALSGAGFALTQGVIRRFGRRGALVSEGVCVGLLVRDAVLIGMGTPRLLRRGPALLLWLELIAATAAVAAGLRPVLDEAAAARAAGGEPPDAGEIARRAAVATLFGLHTVRFHIYLQPDRGLRPGAP